jgi:TRAP-type C4-dicarboxylate transport system permease small subunit
MDERSSLVLPTQRHLKWPVLDPLERLLMILCGVALTGFTITVFCDVVTRTIGAPWLWLQEVTSHFFVYGVFIGAAVASRRNDHLYLSALAESMPGRWRFVCETFNRLVILGVALVLVVFGYVNFLQGLGNFRMPSGTPLSSMYAAIPLCGILVALFTVEQLVNGWRHGYEGREEPGPEAREKELHLARGAVE